MPPIDNPYQYFDSSLDWSDPEFQARKAYLCCLFSQFAYLEVNELELIGTERLKIIPCAAFSDLVSAGVIQSARAVLREYDFSETFVVTTAHAISIGVLTPYMIVIAIRGTAPWYSYSDWIINLDAKRIPGPAFQQPVLHRGFYEATSDLCCKLSEELQKWLGRRLPIYLTGHSLGGAMSSILFGLWQPFLPEVAKITFPTAAYTFGSPRYGTAEAMQALPAPFHIYSPKDLVPTIPPRWRKLLKFNFCDGQREYELHEGKLTPGARSGFWLRGFKYHLIEKYRESLLKAL